MSPQRSLPGITGDPTWEERRPGPDPVAEARAILAEAIEEHNPSAAYVLFSGGNDSTATAHIASQHPSFDGCFTALTGIHDESMWLPHVVATAARFGWPLEMEQTRESYEDIVLGMGFPGPAFHFVPYQRLKERAYGSFARRVREERGRGPVLYVGGRRKQESQRRLKRLTHPIEVGSTSETQGVVFCSPLFWWTKEERDAYATAHDLPRNPVKELTGTISGDCFCGAMADQGRERSERRLIEVWFPEIHRRLSELEDKAAAAGVWPLWGVKPSETYSRAMRQNQYVLGLNDAESAYLCTGCEVRAAHDAETQEAA